VCCSVLQCVAVCCNVLQCVAVCCSVLHSVAVCCSGLPWVAVGCRGLPWVAVCCSVLQCDATCGIGSPSVRECVVVCCSMVPRACDALRCSVVCAGLAVSYSVLLCAFQGSAVVLQLGTVCCKAGTYSKRVLQCVAVCYHENLFVLLFVFYVKCQREFVHVCVCVCVYVCA